MKKPILVFHTSSLIVGSFDNYINKYFPELKMIHFVDNYISYLLQKEPERAAIIEDIIKTHIGYFNEVDAIAIQSTCTSLSGIISRVKKNINKPIFTFDEDISTAISAVKSLNPLAIYTVESTIKTSFNVIREGVGESGSPHCLFLPNAFEYIQTGNVVEHNRIILNEISNYQKKYDSVVLQQCSTLPVLSLLRDNLSVPILHSIESTAKRLKLMFA